MSVEVAQLEQHRAVLTGHCYRMLGSPSDADEAVQETLMRARRRADRVADDRSALVASLYKIATNVCLDALVERTRRTRPLDDGPCGTVDDELATRPHRHWLEPVADARVIPADATPDERVALRHSIRLAFVAALQHLPPRQRAALLLTEVLGWPIADAAEAIGSSVASIDSALQRARLTLATRAVHEPAVLTDAQRALIDQYVDAFERFDVPALAQLLTDDAVLSMPPNTLWLQGPDAISAWLLGRGSGCRGSKLVRLEACGGFAFAQYRDGGDAPFALIVLEVLDARVTSMTSFLDTATLFPQFGLPARYPGPDWIAAPPIPALSR